MAKTFSTSYFTGYDFSNEDIQNAKNKSLKLCLTNTCFEKQDVANFNHEEQFDLITALLQFMIRQIQKKFLKILETH